MTNEKQSRQIYAIMTSLILVAGTMTLSIPYQEAYAAIEVDDCDDDQNISAGDRVIMVGDIMNVSEICILLEFEGITFDCKGHTIDGTDELGSEGINISASGVTVKNCNFTNLGIGIELLPPAEESTITKNTLTSNFNGILLNKADNNKITANSSTGNMNNGLFLVESNSNQIQRNDFSDNMNFGILLTRSDDNVVNANNVDGNTMANMHLNGSDNNTIKRNTFNDGSDNGLDVSLSSMGNNIISNTANDNAATGFADFSSDSGTAGTANTYLRNSCSGNSNDSNPTGLCS